MQKQDTLTQLKQLKQKLKNTLPKNNKNNEIEGQIIQILRKLTYFKSEAQMYGIEILFYYIPIIQPYILRAGMQIISDCQEYVVVQGVVKGVKNSGMMGNVYTDGMIIDTNLENYKSQEDRQALSSSSECDTKLIKIVRNSNDLRLNKHTQNLNKFQKQRLSKQRDMQRIMISDKSLQQSKQKLKNFQFFQSLGSYDLNQLVINSKIIYAKKSTVLHEFGYEVNRVGFLLYGEVKIDNSVIHNRQKPVEAGRLLLEKYMVHKKQHTSSVVSMVQKGEWIGLEEYLWGQPGFLSNAEIVSHDAQVLYIPTEIFSKKFNSLTSYYLMSKLKGLIQTKKKILDKQIKTKREKQDQVTFEKMRREALEKMQQKIERNYQSQKKQKKSISPQSNASLIKSRRKSTHRHFPSQCYMPDRLVHKIKVYEQKYQSLPRIQQRLVLFPEEYEKAMIPLQLRQQLKAAKNARNKTISKKKLRPFKLLSSEKVYETVIYATLSPKNGNPEKDDKSSVGKLKSKASIEYSIDRDYNKMEMLETIGSVSNTTKVRFNASIFNNFRAPKNKGQRLLQNITKTLQII